MPISRRLMPVLVLLLCAGAVDAQSIASRVAAVNSGTVEMHFAGRPGVCGNGVHYFSFGGNSFIGDVASGRDRDRTCFPGPVRVRLQIDDGAVQNIRAYVGPLPAARRNEAVTDLGAVPAHEAAAYFLDLAARNGGGASSKAILPSILADSISVWRPLLAIARDQSRSRSTRTDAAFWLSRFASAKLHGHPEDLGTREAEEKRDDDPRNSAIFALSQLRNGEGVLPLVQVARTNRDARLQSQALFWLSQSGDRRGLDVMEEILTR